MVRHNGDEAAAMKSAFDLLEEGWTKQATRLLSRRDFKAAREGACGIMAYVTPQQVLTLALALALALTRILTLTL